MKEGKLPPQVLSRLVLAKTGAKRQEVLLPPGLGEDSTALALGDQACVLATDPITAAEAGVGELAVHISCNDIAACGAEPVGILLTVLLAPEDDEEKLARIMDEVHGAAKELGIAILGGHTEVTSSVRRTVLSVTAVGKCPQEKIVRSSGAKLGDEVFVTKALALEGTAILVTELAEKLAGVLTEKQQERALAFRQELSVVSEALAAAELGATAMHDVTEGGILGALWELAAASKAGLRIDEAEIPVREETRLVAEALGIDPLGLIGSGALLITAPADAKLAVKMREWGYTVTKIGQVVAEAEGLILETGSGENVLVPPARDELYRAFGN